MSAQRAAAKEENRNCSVAAVPVGTSALTASVKVFGCRPFIDHCCPPRQGQRSKTSKEGNRESEGRRRRATYGDLRVAGVCCRAVGMTIKDDFEG